MKKLPSGEQAAKDIAVSAQGAGFLDVAALDEYLSTERLFDRRVDWLIEQLGDTPIRLERRPGPPGRSNRSERGDDDSLRRYLRQVGRTRMTKDEEVVVARRLEFVRRRFEATVRAARVQEENLREVLGGEYSMSYARDMNLEHPQEARKEAALAEPRRYLIRDRARELNTVRAEFVERNLSIVVDIGLAYRTYGVPLMDLVQEGNSSLIRAVEKFDWRKGVRFQTYATFWIRQAVERSIACNKGIVRVPNYLQQKMRRLRRQGVLPRRDREVSVREVSAAFEVKPEVASHLLETERTHYSLDVTIDDEGETFASLLPDESAGEALVVTEHPLLRRRLDECLETLSDLEREILRLRYGLDGSDPLTLEEVGQRMNVSRERIRQLQVRAIRKLQRPGLLQRLDGFV